eukprot:ctg_698.g343
MTAETPTDSTGQATVSRVERLVADALYDASRSFAAHVRARRLLAEAEAADPPAFVSALFSQLNRCLLVYAREPGVERVMALVASYAAATADAAHYGDQENHTAERDSFCSLLLGYVLSFSNAKDKAVRFRTCQLIALVLNALGEDAEISEALWSALSEALIERTRDRVPAVRAQAVAALCRLQNPDADDDDALLNGYVQWMTSDSSRAVRRAALLHAALLPGLPTLDAAVTRVRDVCSDVRRAALERVLAKKVDPRLLSIEQRVQIIEGGAHDRHRPVREACLQRLLLQAWLRGVCASNLVELLRMLDVEANEERLRDAVLQMLVECASSDWEAVVRTPAGNGETDAERALDWNALTPESAAALAWQTQAAVLRSRRSKQRPSPQPLDETDWAERLAPAAPDVAAALEYHMDQLRRMDSVEAAAGHGSAFIARMLLQTVCWLDATDEAGRRLLLPWLRAMLAEAQATPTETVVPAASGAGAVAARAHPDAVYQNGRFCAVSRFHGAAAAGIGTAAAAAGAGQHGARAPTRRHAMSRAGMPGGCQWRLCPATPAAAVVGLRTRRRRRAAGGLADAVRRIVRIPADGDRQGHRCRRQQRRLRCLARAGTAAIVQLPDRPAYRGVADGGGAGRVQVVVFAAHRTGAGAAQAVAATVCIAQHRGAAAAATVAGGVLSGVLFRQRPDRIGGGGSGASGRHRPGVHAGAARAGCGTAVEPAERGIDHGVGGLFRVSGECLVGRPSAAIAAGRCRRP